MLYFISKCYDVYILGLPEKMFKNVFVIAAPVVQCGLLKSHF